MFAWLGSSHLVDSCLGPSRRRRCGPEKRGAALKQIHDVGTVDAALALLRQHLARPPGIFDPHAAIATLEHLVDVVTDKADERAPGLAWSFGKHALC